MSKRWASVMVSAALVAAIVLSSAGTIDAHHAVLRFNLEEMTTTADRIFVGRCLAVEETEEMIAQGKLPVTLYTFEIERAIKGKLPKQITIRQLGHPARRAGKGGPITMHGRAVSPKTFLHGMSEYRVGDQMVLFLIPNYMGDKVTYPVGLYQGAFFVSDMPSGQKVVRNSINNLGLFTAPYNGTSMRESNAKFIFPERGEVRDAPQGLSAQTAGLVRKRGALPIEDFLGLVEQIVIAHGGERGAITGSQKGALKQ
jgi:hypothetical protein